MERSPGARSTAASTSTPAIGWVAAAECLTRAVPPGAWHEAEDERLRE
jgi:hypothetical protein